MNHANKSILIETPHSSSPAVAWLRQQYINRRQKNSAYSLRAFARHLEISAPRLCDVINGKRPLTIKMAGRIADRLELSPTKRDWLFKALTVDRQASGSRSFTKKKLSAVKPTKYFALQEDIFASVATWYHFAIMELIRTQDFQRDARWVGKRLGISPTEARQAMERLLRLGLLEDRDGTLMLPHLANTTTQDIPSGALRASHRQSLEMAIQSLTETPIDLRDITSITTAIDVRNIAPAKQLIKKFRRQLSALLEQGELTEVYNLNIQLVPVTKSRGVQR